MEAVKAMPLYAVYDSELHLSEHIAASDGQVTADHAHAGQPTHGVNQSWPDECWQLYMQRVCSWAGVQRQVMLLEGR